MSGFERERFVGLKDEDYEDIKCGICLGVMNKPFVTQCCGQSYCCQCINEWLKTAKTCVNCRKNLTKNKLNSAPRFAINLIEKLDIKCDFEEFGCIEVSKLGQLEQHLKCCPFNPINKCSVCGQTKGVDHYCQQIMANNSLQEEMMAIKKSNTKLKSRLRQMKDKNKELKNIMAQELLIKSNENQSLCLNISQFETQIVGFVEQIDTLKREKNDIIEQNKSFHSENEKFKNENKELRNHCQKFLNEKEVYVKSIETLKQESEKLKVENDSLNQQLSNSLIELKVCKEENEELEKHQSLNEQHMSEVIKSARDHINSPEIIRSKLSKISQVIAINRMIKAIEKFETFKEIAQNLKSDIEEYRRGIFWNTIVFSNSSCHSINYSNEDIIDVSFGLLRIKLISV